MKFRKLALLYALFLLIISPFCILGDDSQETYDTNYIRVKFINSVSYTKGFGFDEYYQAPNEYRRGIDLIQINGKSYKPNEALTISKNSEIKIIFNYTQTNLTNFFHSYYDPNVEEIISIDLSHFDSSLLEASEGLFYGCISLQSIDLTNFTAPLLTNMDKMFFSCSSLKSIDLSYLKSKQIKFINRLFCGCASLNYLNLNNTDMSKVQDANYMLYNVKLLMLLSIYGLNKNDIFMNQINELLIDYDDLMVCQNEKSRLITNNNYIYFCLDNTPDVIEGECSSSITIYFEDDVNYIKGFLFNEKDVNIPSRNSIPYIYYDNNLYNRYKKLNVKKNTNLTLCFPPNVASLESFFDSSLDINTQKIISIDLSNFDSSSVTNMNSMFSGCTGLMALDMRNMNLENIANSENIFKDITNLRFINVKEIKNIEKIDTSVLENLKLLVCNNSEVFNSINSIYYCCEFDLEEKKCHTNNYIRVKYNQNKEYNSGFQKGATYILYKGSIFKSTDNLNIQEYNYMEIHFGSPVESLKNFFSSDEQLISVDFSNLNTSKLKYISELFLGCSSIEEINFTNFQTSLVQNMSYMFTNCSKLKSLDLSSFRTSEVYSFMSMFEGCISLEFLDFSHFETFCSQRFRNLLYVSPTTNMFKNVKKLKYINLANAEGACAFNHFSNYDNYFVVCEPDQEFIQSEKKIVSCEFNNYIIVKYNQNTTYDSFIRSEYIRPPSYIINEGLIFPNNERISFKANNSIEINFSSPVINLYSFFDYNLDEKVDKISLIDFSHFNSSELEGIFSMFRGCSSIEEINFTNFQTSLVQDMSYMFEGCSSLKSLDLSNFDTSSVTAMHSMFQGCSALKSLDLSNFNTLSATTMQSMFEGCSSLKSLDLPNFDTSLVTEIYSIFKNCESLEYLDISNFDINCKFDYRKQEKRRLEDSYCDDEMFSNIEKLKYINLYNTEYYDNFKNKLTTINEINNLTVCQKENFIDNPTAINVCKFIPSNYIIVYYKNDTIYKNGFKYNKDELNKYRNGIDYIIIDNRTINSSDYLEIKSNSSIIINMQSSIKDISHFFDMIYDRNAKNIISIDFTNFNSSLITDINSLFKGCVSLNKIIFSNFSTSLVKNMSEMFLGCKSLKEIDLFNFNTSSVIDMSNIFSGCTKLEYLDLNNVKMDNIITAHNMFKALDNLKYINLIEVQNSFQNISKTQLNKDTGLIICQSDLRITNPDAVYKCCNYNIAQGQCPFAQYMRLFFGENITYKSGFDFGTQSNKELLNDNILVIKDRKLINKNEALNITPDNII